GVPTERKRAATIGSKSLDLVTASRKKGPVTYSAAFGDLATAIGDDPKPILDAARDEFVKAVKGKLAEERAMSFDGLFGRELKVEVPRSVVAGGALVRARIFVGGARLYELSAVMPSKQAILSAKELDAFFASFKVTGKPPASKDASNSREVQ